MILLPADTGNELRQSKLPPAVKPIESSAVPSSITYVSRGTLASNDLTNACLRVVDAAFDRLPASLAFGCFDTGALKALAGASLPVKRTAADVLPAAEFCFMFRCASANGIAQTATSRRR